MLGGVALTIYLVFPRRSGYAACSVISAQLPCFKMCSMAANEVSAGSGGSMRHVTLVGCGVLAFAVPAYLDSSLLGQEYVDDF
eukprot:6459182-Amphidinium_carterae.4